MNRKGQVWLGGLAIGSMLIAAGCGASAPGNANGNTGPTPVPVAIRHLLIKTSIDKVTPDTQFDPTNAAKRDLLTRGGL